VLVKPLPHSSTVTTKQQYQGHPSKAMRGLNHSRNTTCKEGMIMCKWRKIFVAVGIAFSLGIACGLQFALFSLAHTNDGVDMGQLTSTLRGGSASAAHPKNADDKTVVRISDGKRQWDNWPAVAFEEVGHSLVAKGESFFDHARELYFGGKNPLINEFLEVYKNRPDPVNLCGIRINHAMGLFLAVKQLKPTLVVESGVNAGVSTYFIRKASPTTRIFAVDPLDKPICDQGKRWIDRENQHLTTYYTGSNFVDIIDMDWKGMIERKEVDPATTMVFLDDHLHAFERIARVMAHDIKHIVVEDNYKQNEGATPLDRRSTPKQMFAGGMWRAHGDWLWKRTKNYSEFPPLVPPIMAKVNNEPRKPAGGFMVASDTNTDIVAPILRPDLDASDDLSYQKAMTYLGINPNLEDRDSYMQVMNYNQFLYIELQSGAAATATTFPK